MRWTSPSDSSTGMYVEACIEKTVPGSNFVPLFFNGGYIALQDSPEGLLGLRRITFHVQFAKQAEAEKSNNGIAILDSPQCTTSRNNIEGVEILHDEMKWEVAHTLKFLVLHAGVNDGLTNYAAYADVGKGWQLLASVSVERGKSFVGYMSYIQDQLRDGNSAVQERRAQFGPIWFRNPEGKWLGAKLATFTSIEAAEEDPDNIYTTSKIDQQKGITGSRVLATGGHLESHRRKIGESHKVNTPPETMPSDLPAFPKWFDKMAHPVHQKASLGA